MLIVTKKCMPIVTHCVVCFSVDLLLENGAKVNAKNKKKATSLHMAAQEGCQDCVDALLAAGADINAQSITGDTPLLKAVVKGMIETQMTTIDFHILLTVIGDKDLNYKCRLYSTLS